MDPLSAMGLRMDAIHPSLLSQSQKNNEEQSTSSHGRKISTREHAQANILAHSSGRLDSLQLSPQARELIHQALTEDSQPTPHHPTGVPRISIRAALSPEARSRLNIMLDDLFPDLSMAVSTHNQVTTFELSPGVSSELMTFIQMIKQISRDPEQLNRFLDRVDQFLQNQEQNPSDSFEELMQDLDGILKTKTQITESVQRQENLTLRVAQIMAQQDVGLDEIEITEDGQILVNGEIQQADPLVFDLDGDGIELTSVDQGVEFDLSGQGKTLSAFVTGGDAFLALDRNGNGRIDSGKELFGDQHGAVDGIEELRKFDENQDNVIDAKDSIFHQLRLYAEQNADDISQPNELFTLQEMNIASISLQKQNANLLAAGGNRITSYTSFTREDGSKGLAADVMLKFLK